MQYFDTLVLGGNSTNAISTLGSLQRLLDEKVLVKTQLKTLVGTSSGSLINTLFAIGYDPIEMLSHICVNHSYSKIIGLNLTSGALMDFMPIQTELESMIETKLGHVPTLAQVHDRFDKRLIFVTFNMTQGKKEYIDFVSHPNLPITKACCMSSCFPFVFAPFQHDGCFYADGGLVDNFAMSYAQTLSERVFGLCNVNPIKPHTPDTNYMSMFLTLLSVMICSFAENVVVVHGTSRVVKLVYDKSFFNFNETNSNLIGQFDKGYDLCKNRDT